MKKLTIAILAVSASLTSFAHAETYVGAGLGVDSDYYDGVDSDNNYDHSGTAYNIYAGYYFNRVIGVEANYANYGKFSFDNSYESGKLSAKVASISANIGYSFDCGVRPFILLGASYGKIEATGQEHNTPQSFEKSDGGIHLGVGLEYAPTANFAVRIMNQADSVRINDHGNNPVLNMVSLGAAYKF